MKLTKEQAKISINPIHINEHIWFYITEVGLEFSYKNANKKVELFKLKWDDILEKPIH